MGKMEYPDATGKMDCPEDAAPSDDALMLAMKNGDQTVFRALVERHIDRAYALALRILGNRADAEDIAQDAFIRLWTMRERWEPGRAKVSTWLYRVVVNRAIDIRRRDRGSGLDGVPEPEDESMDAVGQIQFGQVSQQINVAISRLSEPQRAAIALYYYEDMSVAEIADILETTIGSVESLLKRARQRLRQTLQRCETDMRELLMDNRIYI